MRYIPLAAAAAGFLLQAMSSASAQSVTRWVASNGNDGNSCARSQPCATFAGALLRTPDGGTILCADSGSFGNTDGTGLSIAQGVEIDCRNHTAFIEVYSTSPSPTGVVISVTDPVNQSVVLRGVTVSGRLGSEARANTPGIRITAAKSVTLNHVHVEQFAQQGLIDARSLAANSQLLLIDSTFAGNTGPGIVSAVTINGFNDSALLERVTSVYNGYGLALAANNRARITNSTFSYNNIGIHLDAGANVVMSKSVVAYSSTVAYNGNGVSVVGENDISFTPTVFSGAGNTYTNGNNRLHFYNNVGVAPTTQPASSSQGQR